MNSKPSLGASRGGLRCLALLEFLGLGLASGIAPTNGYAVSMTRELQRQF